MSEVEDILRESIQDRCGLGGLLRFNALNTGSFERADGEPDLAGIGAAVSGTFPADQASAIMAAVARRLDDGGRPGKRHYEAPAESQGTEAPEVPAAFANYFNAEPGHIRDIVSEARRMRVAMGKTTPPAWAPQADKVIVAQEKPALSEAELAAKATVIRDGDAIAGKANACSPVAPQPVNAPETAVRQPGNRLPGNRLCPTDYPGRPRPHTPSGRLLAGRRRVPDQLLQRAIARQAATDQHAVRQPGRVGQVAGGSLAAGASAAGVATGAATGAALSAISSTGRFTPALAARFSSVSLVGFDSGPPDNVTPLRDLALDVGGEFLGRARERLGAGGGEALLHLGRLQDPRELGV